MEKKEKGINVYSVLRAPKDSGHVQVPRASGPPGPALSQGEVQQNVPLSLQESSQTKGQTQAFVSSPVSQVTLRASYL